MTTVSYPWRGGFVEYGTPEWQEMKDAQAEASAERRVAREAAVAADGWTWSGGGTKGVPVDPYGWTTGSALTPEMYRTAYERGNPAPPSFYGGTENYGAMWDTPYGGPPPTSQTKPQVGPLPGQPRTYGTMENKPQTAQPANSPYIGMGQTPAGGTQDARFSPLQKAGYIQGPQAGPQISEGGPLAMQMAQAAALRG